MINNKTTLKDPYKYNLNLNKVILTTLRLQMSNSCLYCKKEFATKRSLDHHTRTAKYCLKLQEANGVAVEKAHFVCKCSRQFRVKYNYDRHVITCNSKIESNTTKTSNNINTVNNQGTIIQNQNNNIQINIYGTTLSDISQEEIYNRLYSSFRESIPDLAKIIKAAMDKLAYNNYKNPIIISCDKTRDKFRLRYDKKDVDDWKANKTIGLFYPTLLTACTNAINEGENIEEIETLINAIKNRDRKTLDLLHENVKPAFTVDETEKIFAQNEAETTKALDEVNIAISKAKAAKIEKEKAEKKAKFLANKRMIKENLSSRADTNGNRVHIELKYLVQIPDPRTLYDPEGDFVIVGKRVELEEIDNTVKIKDVDLDKGDIANIKNMGLEDCLHEKYRIKKK
jgi:hypothetical protein